MIPDSLASDLRAFSGDYSLKVPGTQTIFFSSLVFYDIPSKKFA